MSDSPSFRVELMQETVAWAEKLDERGADSTSRLDDKSQQTGTVAGVFLAAALGFLTPNSLAGFGPHVRIVVGALLSTGVLVLVGCVAACLAVTWLRFVPTPITLGVMRSLTEDIAQHTEAEIDPDVMLAAYRERLKIWQPVLDSRLILNRAKASRLHLAQVLLAAGIFIISILLFTICWAIITGSHT